MRLGERMRRAGRLAMLAIALLVLFASSVIPAEVIDPRSVEAGTGGTVRQEINLLNSAYTGTNVAISTTEVAHLDTTQYSGTVSYYFEIIGTATALSTGSIRLRQFGTTTDSATIATSGVGVTNSRVRSAAFSPPAGQTTFFVYADAGGAARTVTLKAARIIVIQNSDPLTKTETQVEIGSKVVALTNTTAAPLTNPKYWRYTAANWDGTVTFSAEAVHKVVNTTVTIVLQEDNGSFGTWTNKATIATSTATTTTVSSVAFTPVDGRHYRIVASRAAGGGTRNYDIYNAKIVVNQTNTAPAPNITKLEPQYLLLNTADSNAVGQQAFMTQFDPAEWTSLANTYRFAIDSDNAANSAKLQNLSNSNADIVGSVATGANHVISSAMTMPATSSTLDMNVTNTTGVIASGRIIVQALLPIISVAVTDGTVTYGMIPPGSSRDTASAGLNDTQVATNDGNIAEDFNIRGQNSAGWTLAGSAGTNQYRHDFCVSGTGTPDPCDAGPTWTALTTSYQTLGTNIAVSGTRRFDLRVTAPTTSTANTQQNVSVTIQAVQR